ncbi:MAG: hypothetical protein ACR2HO_05095 [Rubrobacteraceae bacterium]|nr:hypothetical protein [Rubrobacter sp.]
MDQVFVLLVLIILENEILLDFDGLVENFLFVFLPAFLPSLVVGVLAGLSVFPTRMRWAVLARIGATVLVVALGVGITFLGGLAMFSLYESTSIALGQLLGAFVGMEAALGLSLGTAILIGRIRRARRRQS